MQANKETCAVAINAWRVSRMQGCELSGSARPAYYLHLTALRRRVSNATTSFISPLTTLLLQSNITMAADIQAPAVQSRSPSPVAAPPIQAAPGPRATALQKLYSDAIAHVLKTCNYSNFSSCFPTPAREVPGSLKLLHEQFTEKLGESMRKEFDAILDDRHVVGSLNELDGLIEEARRRKGRGDAAPVP